LSLRRAGRGRSLNPHSLAALCALLVAGCTETRAPEAGSAAVASSAIAPILAETWHAAVVQNPVALEAMLDGPGGAGWLALFHGDLDAAESAFTEGLAAAPDHRACHLGLARVSLSRVDLLLAERDLARRVVPELAAYRAERADRVRVGPLEPLTAALSLVGLHAAPDQTERAVAAAGAWTPGPDADPEMATALRELLARRIAGNPEPPDALPLVWASRLRSAQNPAATDPGALGDGAKPDLVERLGGDSDTGISFELSWWDPSLAEARLRVELRRLTSHALAAEHAGRPLAAIASELSHGELPGLPADREDAGLRDLMLFGAQWTNVADLRAAWGLPDGRSFLDQVAGAVPDESLLQGETGPDTDRVLRYAQTLLDQSKAELQALASEQGKALVRDLELPQKLHDHVLRQRMMMSLGAGEPVRALRLGERSLDVTGSKQGGLTRLSHRNDAGYLVRLAHVHSAGGRPGVARDYVHPLTSRFPALGSVSYTLGQLDAASSIGVQGKTSQQ